MAGIVALIPDAYHSDLEAALTAVKGQLYTLIVKVTTEENPTWETPATHWHMNDESAVPADATLYAACKLGDIPEVDQLNGNPILWGQNGLISLAAAEAAFAQMQWQMNDSEVSPVTFVENFLRDLNLRLVPGFL